MENRWVKSLRGMAAVCAIAALVSAAAAAAPGQLLRRLETAPAGWDGIRLGMSLVQLERRIGETLSIAPAQASPVCSRFASRATFQGYGVVLGFASAKPGAKLESLWIDFDADEVGATVRELAAALRSRVPAASHAPDASRPAASEEADPTPTYVLPGDPPVAVRFTPRDGALIALRTCLR